MAQDCSGTGLRRLQVINVALPWFVEIAQESDTLMISCYTIQESMGNSILVRNTCRRDPVHRSTSSSIAMPPSSTMSQRSRAEYQHRCIYGSTECTEPNLRVPVCLHSLESCTALSTPHSFRGNAHLTVQQCSSTIEKSHLSTGERDLPVIGPCGD